MKFKGLDGREYSISLSGYVTKNIDTIERSSYHIRARNLLKKIYSSYQIIEELYLPGTGSLKLDLFVPLMYLGIEVHGEQHYRYIPGFFHKDILDFVEHKKRDENKRLWCELNKIILVELPYDQSDSEWETRIKDALC